MMSKPLEDDSDPTYTHFAHREEFLKLLGELLKLDLSQTPDTEGNETEEKLVTSQGAIVGSTIEGCDDAEGHM